jgi:hypothetical protein
MIQEIAAALRASQKRLLLYCLVPLRLRLEPAIIFLNGLYFAGNSESAKQSQFADS